MLRIATLLAAASALTVFVVSPHVVQAATSGASAYPHQGETPGTPDTSSRVGRHDVPRKAVFMVGDSITTLAFHHGLYKARPGWEISSVPGRDDSNMPWYVKDRLADKTLGRHAKRDPQNPSGLKTFVWALGTNADSNWTYNDFRDTVRLLPRKTRLVFVTTWRDPKYWSKAVVSDFRRQSESQAPYNRWMHHFDQVRAHTCIFNWRSMVQAHPGYLHDGVHPGTTGIRMYVRGLTNVVSRCG
jgi:hypothetical protein